MAGWLGWCARWLGDRPGRPPTLRRFEDLGEHEKACALVAAREALLAAYGGGLPWHDQELLMVSYLRRQGIRYTPHPDPAGPADDAAGRARPT